MKTKRPLLTLRGKVGEVKAPLYYRAIHWPALVAAHNMHRKLRTNRYRMRCSIVGYSAAD